VRVPQPEHGREDQRVHDDDDLRGQHCGCGEGREAERDVQVGCAVAVPDEAEHRPASERDAEHEQQRFHVFLAAS
jgi:hypothetical protein